MIGLRMLEIERMPELRGGAVRVDPASLRTELSARHDKAQQLAQASPQNAELVTAAATLRECVAMAEQLRQQEEQAAERSTRADVSDEVRKDPELANSPQAVRAELERDPEADPADAPEDAIPVAERAPAQSGRGRPTPTGKPPLVRVGTVSTGKPGEVFNISSLPADAPHERPTPTDSRPPRAGYGVRSWSRHARTQHSRTATAITSRRVASQSGGGVGATPHMTSTPRIRS